MKFLCYAIHGTVFNLITKFINYLLIFPILLSTLCIISPSIFFSNRIKTSRRLPLEKMKVHIQVIHKLYLKLFLSGLIIITAVSIVIIVGYDII